jgi:hypothetical protein
VVMRCVRPRRIVCRKRRPRPLSPVGGVVSCLGRRARLKAAYGLLNEFRTLPLALFVRRLPGLLQPNRREPATVPVAEGSQSASWRDGRHQTRLGHHVPGEVCPGLAANPFGTHPVGGMIRRSLIPPQRNPAATVSHASFLPLGRLGRTPAITAANSSSVNWQVANGWSHAHGKTGVQLVPSTWQPTPTTLNCRPSCNSPGVGVK